VHFVGRLATYKYYNMDQIVAQALTVYSKMSGANKRSESTLRVAGKPKVAVAAASSNGNGNGNSARAKKVKVAAGAAG
jgi:UDP-galactopyranose mutase